MAYLKCGHRFCIQVVSAQSPARLRNKTGASLSSSNPLGFFGSQRLASGCRSPSSLSLVRLLGERSLPQRTGRNTPQHPNEMSPFSQWEGQAVESPARSNSGGNTPASSSWDSSHQGSPTLRTDLPLSSQPSMEVRVHLILGLLPGTKRNLQSQNMSLTSSCEGALIGESFSRRAIAH